MRLWPHLIRHALVLYPKAGREGRGLCLVASLLVAASPSLTGWGGVGLLRTGDRSGHFGMGGEGATGVLLYPSIPFFTLSQDTISTWMALD